MKCRRPKRFLWQHATGIGRALRLYWWDPIRDTLRCIMICLYHVYMPVASGIWNLVCRNKFSPQQLPQNIHVPISMTHYVTNIFVPLFSLSPQSDFQRLYLLISCSHEYWIGLAQVNSKRNAYWVDGTQFTGSYGNPAQTGSTKCIIATMKGENVELKARSCSQEKKFICEDTTPPGKKT